MIGSGCLDPWLQTWGVLPVDYRGVLPVDYTLDLGIYDGINGDFTFSGIYEPSSDGVTVFDST